jgi:hypothetical protein
MRYSLPSALLLAAAACNSPNDPRSSDVLELRAQSGDLVFTNHARGTLATFVIAASVLPAANWSFCPEVATCTGEQAGATWHRSLASIYGYSSGGEIVVFWKELGYTIDGRRVFLREGRESIRP